MYSVCVYKVQDVVIAICNKFILLLLKSTTYFVNSTDHFGVHQEKMYRSSIVNVVFMKISVIIFKDIIKTARDKLKEYRYLIYGRSGTVCNVLYKFSGHKRICRRLPRDVIVSHA